MKTTFKKTTILLILVIGVSFATYTSCFAIAERSGPARVNLFLREIFGIDTEKYGVSVVSDIIDNPADYPGIVRQAGKYTLMTSGSKLEVLFDFHNETLFYCSVNNIEGSPLYAEPLSGNLIHDVEVFLERYESLTGYPVDEQRATLNMISELKDSTQALGNVKLKVTELDGGYSFFWSYVFEGVDYRIMGFTFLENGSFGFGDDRGTYKIGGTDVNITGEQAKGIALECARNLSLPYPVRDSPIEVKLQADCREPLTLYSCWHVIMYLDIPKPGGITHVIASIWADTGEVIYCRPLTWGGVGIPPEEENTENSDTSNSNSDGETSASGPTVIATSVVIFAVLAGGALLLVRKGRTKLSRVASNTPIQYKIKSKTMKVTSVTSPEEILALGKAGWTKYDEITVSGITIHFYRNQNGSAD